MAWLVPVIALLASCGSDSDGSSASDTRAPAATTAATTAATGATTAATTAPTKELSAELVAAAKKEGSVNVYSNLPEAAAVQMQRAFQDKYGIKLTTTRLTSAPMNTRLKQEADAGVYQVDAIIGSDATIFTTSPNLFTDLSTVSSALPSLEAWPAERKRALSADFMVSPIFLGYNKDLVPKSDLPKTWNDLLDPKWKNKIFYTDPRASSTTAAFYWIIAEKSGLGLEYFKRLAANGAKVVDSASAAVQLVAAGERSLFFPASGSQAYGLSTIQSDHVPGYTSVNTVHTSLLVKSPHPNAAKVFLNWLLSREGQSVVLTEESGIFASSPRFADVGAPMPKDIIPLDIAAGAKNTADIAAALGLT